MTERGINGTDSRNMATVANLILVLWACAGRHGDVIIMSALSVSGLVSPNTIAKFCIC